MMAQERVFPGRMPSILLLGPTGSGKTPLGRMFEDRGFRGRRCLHFDFGARLREAAGRPESGAFLGPAEMAVVRNSLRTGALLEDDDFPIALKILAALIDDRGWTGDDLLVLNGLPRHIGQAEKLAGRADVVLTVVLECPARVILERLRLDTGGDRAEREDDDPDSVARRLRTFEARTRPLLEFYGRLGVPESRIEVTSRMTAAEMYDRLSASAPRIF